MESVSVLFPYKPDGGWRDRVFDWITRRYQTLWPEFELCVGTNDEEPFSRSKARNNAFREATGDFLIINDADTFCNRSFIDRSLEMLRSTPSPTWVLPYATYYNLAQDFSLRVLEEHETTDLSEDALEFDFRVDGQRHPPDGSVAGVFMVTREAFEAVGGYDEGYIGWGYEDDAFARSLDRKWGYHSRLSDGFVTHLWHPPAPDGDFKNPFIEHNRTRYAQLS